MAAAPPGVAAADPSQRQPASPEHSVSPERFNRVNGAAGGKPATGHGPEQERLQRGKRHPVKPNKPDQQILNRIWHVLARGLQQPGPVQRGDHIPLHFGKRLPGDGWSSDEHQVHRLVEFPLVKPVGFLEQTTGSVAHHGASHLPTGDDPQPRRASRGDADPVGHHRPMHQPTTRLLGPSEIPALLHALGSTESQPLGGGGHWGTFGVD